MVTVLVSMGHPTALQRTRSHWSMASLVVSLATSIQYSPQVTIFYNLFMYLTCLALIEVSQNTMHMSFLSGFLNAKTRVFEK